MISINNWEWLVEINMDSENKSRISKKKFNTGLLIVAGVMVAGLLQLIIEILLN